MKTKREVLIAYAKNASCGNLDCDECPYNTKCLTGEGFHRTLARIGAIALLRRFPKKREFDTSKVLTCATVDKAKTGMQGYFANDLTTLRDMFNVGETYELRKIENDGSLFCFRYVKPGPVLNKLKDSALFYPVED